MLLTLASQTFGKTAWVDPLHGAPSGKRERMLGMPRYTIDQLELRGLSIAASMLSGWALEDLDQLRDSADKSGCPCLVLVEDKALNFGSDRSDRRAAAADRVRRLGQAAHRLGCNALAIHVAGADSDTVFDRVAEGIKDVMPPLERMELNLLIAPGEKGVTNNPDRLTDLIKRIGGFRIGALPNFAHAHSTGDVVGTLRKLAPYAGAVHATVKSFDAKGKHDGWDLAECVDAIRSAGFGNTLAIEFVGDGDPATTVQQAREQLAAAIEAN